MSTYQVMFDGQPAGDDLYAALSSLEVEENAELPGAFRLKLSVTTSNGDLTWVSDDRLRPFANVAVVVEPDAGPKQCIFDGYVLSHAVHLDTGTTAATLEVCGQDASVLMSLEEKVREWSGVDDGAVANQVFDAYGYTADDRNTAESLPTHSEDAHTLMQRASDRDFLARLARRCGRWCRVVCTDTPGRRTGYFAFPDVGADPDTTLVLNDPAKSQVGALDFTWDVARPTQVSTRQASLSDNDAGGVIADASSSGLSPLDTRDLQTFAGRNVSVVLTAAVDDAELPMRARALLRDASWFADCKGTADLATLKRVLRVGSVVAIQGVGALLSGKYLVTRVHHTITSTQHAMAFVATRNAVGPSLAGGGGGLAGAIAGALA